MFVQYLAMDWLPPKVVKGRLIKESMLEELAEPAVKCALSLVDNGRTGLQSLGSLSRNK